MVPLPSESTALIMPVGFCPQGNVWSLLFDPPLMSALREHSILFQAYNVMNGVLAPAQRRRSPRAAAALDAVAKELRARWSEGEAAYGATADAPAFLSSSTVVLKVGQPIELASRRRSFSSSSEQLPRECPSRARVGVSQTEPS
jgi:hypothetical protein